VGHTIELLETARTMGHPLVRLSRERYCSEPSCRAARKSLKPSPLARPTAWFHRQQPVGHACHPSSMPLMFAYLLDVPAYLIFGIVMGLTGSAIRLVVAGTALSSE
jgi:hypothetical protein